MDLSSEDIVVEIGPGTGILTLPVAKRVKKIYAIEIERDIVKELKKSLKENNISNVDVIEKNFLSVDLMKLSDKPFKVIGNIPYNITSKILIKLFGEIDNIPEHRSLLQEAYLLTQLEVAERLVAKPSTKAYSPLSLLIQFSSIPTLLHKVPRKAFTPPPKVESAFLSFKPKEKLPDVQNLQLVKNLIRISFQQRRKKIINSMIKFFEDKTALENALKELKIDQNLRPENLGFDDYVRISGVIRQ
jgi:16S rRNA (adenine1518-N6/adenine1519-N6)-dimethyltransferase